MSGGSVGAAAAVAKPKKGVPKFAVVIGVIAIFAVVVVGVGFATNWFGPSKAKTFSGTASLKSTDDSYSFTDIDWNVTEDTASVLKTTESAERKYSSPDATPHEEGDSVWYEVTGDRHDGWMIIPSSVDEAGPVGIWALAYVQKNTPDDHFQKDYLWSIDSLKINEDGTCLLQDTWTLTDTVDEAKRQIAEDLSANDAQSVKKRYGSGEAKDGTWEKTSENVIRLTFGSGNDTLGYSLTLSY